MFRAKLLLRMQVGDIVNTNHKILEEWTNHIEHFLGDNDIRRNTDLYMLLF